MLRTRGRAAARLLLLGVICFLVSGAFEAGRTAPSAQATSVAPRESSSFAVQGSAKRDPSKALCSHFHFRKLVLACYDSKTGWKDWNLSSTYFITKGNRLANTGTGGANYATFSALLSKGLPVRDGYVEVISFDYIQSHLDGARFGGIGYVAEARGTGYVGGYLTSKPAFYVSRYLLGSSEEFLTSPPTNVSIGGWHTMYVSFFKGVVSVWLDGVLQLAYPIQMANETGSIVGIGGLGAEFQVQRFLVLKAMPLVLPN